MTGKIKNEFNSEAAFRLISKCSKMVITTHVNPDGDAIGSALGLYFYAVEKGKHAEIIIHSKVPNNYSFLTGADEIQIFDERIDREKILNTDKIFVVDLNDSRRLKSVEEAVLESEAEKIVIDHHMEPKEFADHYFIDTDATSAGEMIYKIIKLDKDYKISKQCADALYAAIMTDSGSFRFPRTDSEVHKIIAELISAGADPVYLYDEIYNKVPIPGFLLKGIAFASTKLFYNGQLAVMSLTKEDFPKAGAVEEDVEDIVENSMHIDGVKVGILVTEMPDRNEFRLSFRSKGDYSIRELAMKFNGGGHKHAAGAKAYNSSLDKVINDVVAEAGDLFYCSKT